MTDNMLFVGRIRTRCLPPITKEEFLAWWPKLSERERDQYTVYETKNLITTAGRAQLLTYIGAAALSAPVVPFAMYFAVGTFPINTVNPGDTAVNGELFRAVPTTSTVTGNTVDISTFFSTSDANGTYTNCGIFGNNATSTPGSGTLVTHALYSYTKTVFNSLTNDYLITLN